MTTATVEDLPKQVCGQRRAQSDETQRDPSHDHAANTTSCIPLRVRNRYLVAYGGQKTPYNGHNTLLSHSVRRQGSHQQGGCEKCSTFIPWLAYKNNMPDYGHQSFIGRLIAKQPRKPAWLNAATDLPPQNGPEKLPCQDSASCIDRCLNIALHKNTSEMG
ncbi:hypothetical protein HPB48_018097 [Haemaphysalis longicornis]|uniref:Uncharacterized protein n=1 Tax=Haemaphysalis longicornis TaxID=44386 RepID=A0A9J6GTC3_HAELO|nr:hypothetical protein HPB48_018097 [Haemaphysalis longicornis]